MGWFDPTLVIAGLAIGFMVGLTGMGGGALLTPVLTFLLPATPISTLISSDIVISLFMKPAGAIVHLIRKTVHWQLVGWLCLGSVPAAFSGALVLDALDLGGSLDAVLKVALGIALLIAAAGLVLRASLGMAQRGTALGEGPADPSKPDVVVRPVATVVLGAVAGFIVGITSVGAGSLIIVVLLLLYPKLKASQLVGTDLVQAVPLVASASISHILFGEVQFGLVGSILIGAIPGALIGAQVSSRAPGGIIRRVLAVLLLASGLKLIGVPTAGVLIAALAALVLGNIAWIAVRHRVNSARGRDPKTGRPLRPAPSPTEAPENSDSPTLLEPTAVEADAPHTPATEDTGADTPRSTP